MNTLINIFRKYFSIKRRLILIIFIPGIIYYIISTVLSFSHIQYLSLARINEIRSVVESAVGKSAAQFLRRGNKQDLDEVLRSLVSKTAVSGAAVYDTDGNIFAQAGIFNETDNTAIYSRSIYHRPLVPKFNELDFNDGVDKGDPILVGKLIFYVDYRTMQDQSTHIIVDDLILLFVVAVVCSPFFYALYQSFNSPLSSILHNIIKFEKGNISWIENNDISADEFTAVQSALQRMATTVIDQTRQIQDANQALEQRAAELERQVKIATEAREDADRANAQKDIFIANVTHEMRHPLVGVVSGGDLAEQFVLCAQNKVMKLRQVATPQQYALLTNICADLKDAINSLGISKAYSRELTVMVDDLLASIQDMHQEITINPSSFLLYDSVNVLFQSYRDRANGKDLEYRFYIKGVDRDASLYAKGDWVRISQVVNSLLDNAFRFTEQGHVWATASIAVSDLEVELSFVIEDTGIGISDNEKVSIFKLFHIGENPADKQYSGMGTGLSIARKVADRINGNLNIEYSHPRVGSRFSFNLSLPVSNGYDTAIDEAIHHFSKTFTILYVEDSATNRQVFKMYCDLYGINLILAQTGIEGMERFMAHKLDALVVDCYMPKMNGYELVSRIREWESHSNKAHVPIFALSADASVRNREKCFAVGFDEFLTKPYTSATFQYITDRITQFSELNI
jgi:signal transduction histidine kinase